MYCLFIPLTLIRMLKGSFNPLRPSLPLCFIYNPILHLLLLSLPPVCPSGSLSFLLLFLLPFSSLFPSSSLSWRKFSHSEDHMTLIVVIKVTRSMSVYLLDKWSKWYCFIALTNCLLSISLLHLFLLKFLVLFYL